MISLVENFLNKYGLLDKKNTLMIGFSGGADSTCLTDIIYNLSLKYGFKLILCHLNHNWRGKDSKADLDFCKSFAQERDIEFVSKTLSKQEKQTETAARELRYKFFEESIEKYNVGGFLLAHNKNDNAETLIYRIIKGTGIKGLCGIPEKRGKFYRPLLNIDRKEIENYCNYENIEYITDCSNFDNKYNRNYIRNEILPKFEKINKDYMDSLNNLSNLAQSEESLVKEYLKSVLENISKDDKILTKEFLKLSKALKQRIILEIFLKYNLDYSYKKINEILEFIQENSNMDCGIKMSLSDTLWLFVSTETLELVSVCEKCRDEICITSEGIYELSDYIFKIEKFNETYPDKLPSDKDFIAYIELKTPINFTLRTRRDGDIIQPLGMTGKMKLKKYLNSKKIKNHNKDNLILFCKDDEIYWACGYGLSEKIKVVKETTHVLSLKKRH